MKEKRVGYVKKGYGYLQHSFFAHEIPKGIKALLIYAVVMAFFYKFFVFLGFYSPAKVGLHASALVINVTILALLLVFIYAVLNKKSWAYHIALLWFSVSILLSLASFAMLATEFTTIRALLILSAFSIIFVDMLALWYIVKKRQYFGATRSVLRYDALDKTFLYTLSSFWIILVILAAGLGFSFYRQSTVLSDKILEELKGASIVHGIVICNDKKGTEHDICYVVLATIYPNQDLRALCGKIVSDFFRWTCLQIR